MTQIRVWVCTRTNGLLMPHMTFMDHFEPSIFLMSSFKSWITFLLSQLISWPKNQLYWEKVNHGQFTVKLHNFRYISTLWTHICQLIKFGPQFLKKFDQIIKRAKWSKLGFWLRKGNFWFFDPTNDQLVWSLISMVKFYHLDLMTWFKTLQIHWIDRWNL